MRTDLFLRLGELANVTIGNVLMGFTLLALFRIQHNNGLGIGEHPADPNDWQTGGAKTKTEDSATIWRTPVMAALLRLPGVTFRAAQQGLYGSSSSKPTGLVTVNLATLDRRLEEWILTDSSPREKSYGLDRKGTFRSAPLKEYPPAMCKAIALAFSDDFDRRFEASEAAPAQVPSAEVLAICKGLIAVQYGEHIGLDFAGDSGSNKQR